jgi:hypothetical protein
MPTLTASSTFQVTEQDALITEEVVVSIISAPPAAPAGTGRLVHPTLGTYDYDLQPTSWSNVDNDIIVRPEWSATKTLTGQKFTLWQGYDEDTVVKEKWEPTGGATAAMRNGQLRSLLDMFVNPPNPPSFVQWYPNYVNAYGYSVVLLSLEVGGEGVTFDFVSKAGLITGEVTLTLQVVEKL